MPGKPGPLRITKTLPIPARVGVGWGGVEGSHNHDIGSRILLGLEAIRLSFQSRGF
jgi:hypothetical protein